MLYPKTFVGVTALAGVSFGLGIFFGQIFLLKSLLVGILPFLILAIIGVILPKGMEDAEKYVDLGILFFAAYFLSAIYI